MPTEITHPAYVPALSQTLAAAALLVEDQAARLGLPLETARDKMIIQRGDLYIGWTLISGGDPAEPADWVPSGVSNSGGLPADPGGLGSLALQNADAVALTGGSISGVAITLTGGLLANFKTMLGLGSAAARNAPASGNAAAAEAVLGSDSRLTDARAPTAHSHAYSSLSGLPPLGSASALAVPAALAAAAASDQVVRGDDPRLFNARSPTTHGHTTSAITGLDAALAALQPLLVSGISLRTINGVNLLGSGNLNFLEAIEDETSTDMTGVLFGDGAVIRATDTPNVDSVRVRGLDGYARLKGGDNGFHVYWKEDTYPGQPFPPVEKLSFVFENYGPHTAIFGPVVGGGLTADRTYQLPDKHGVFAMLSDIPAPVTYAPLVLSVTTDAVKLALTGIQVGQEVIVVNEGRRIEKYTGGAITSQSSWAVLRNTVQLSVAIPSGSGNNIMVNGAAVSNAATPTTAGWADPQAIPFSAQSAATLTLTSITSRTTASQLSTTSPATTIAVAPTAQNHALPVSVPLRGIVMLTLTYPAA